MGDVRSLAPRLALVIASTLSGIGAGCNEADPLTLTACLTDEQCDANELCERGECVPEDELSCASVMGGEPVLQPMPYQVDFEMVGSGTAQQTVVLQNIGTCALTVFEGRIRGGAESPFVCVGCSPEAFPLEIFPYRKVELTIQFTPSDVGSATDVLLLLSDDAAYREIEVPLHARFEGAPELVAAPMAVDFGFVASGRSADRTVRLTNQGSGRAPLTVTDVRIDPPSSPFTATPLLSSPIELLPLAEDAEAFHVLNLRYAPTELATHSAILSIASSAGTVSIPLAGTAETPPQISVSPNRVDFGQVGLGDAQVLPLTIQNQGGSPLSVAYRFGGQMHDFGAMPAQLQDVPPGGYTQLEVMVAPSAIGAQSSVLILESNDPMRPSLSIPVSVDGSDVAGAEVLKVEMIYTNGSSSILDDDLRNVDLLLENPYGLVCGKQEPTPTNWGAFGNPLWFSFGATEEPERVVLPDAQRDGSFRVLVQYAEDCSSIPTTLVATVLGITVEALADYLSGGIIPVDGGDIAEIIDELCVSRSSTNVTVTVAVNGQIIAETSVELTRKGDLLPALEIVRTNGHFSVR